MAAAPEQHLALNKTQISHTKQSTVLGVYCMVYSTVVYSLINDMTERERSNLRQWMCPF